MAKEDIELIEVDRTAGARTSTNQVTGLCRGEGVGGRAERYRRPFAIWYTSQSLPVAPRGAAVRSIEIKR